MYKKLLSLSDYHDDLFQQFYSELLSKDVFAKHFESKQQVIELISRQKENYRRSLTDNEEELFNRYYKIGVIHYEHSISYEVFLSGTHLLKDLFDQAIHSEFDDSNLIILNIAYFDFVSEAMAKGYLDRYLENEITDIEMILSLMRVSTFGTEKQLLINHYKWMLKLLKSIQKKEYQALDELLEIQKSEEGGLYSYIADHLNDTGSKFNVEEIQKIRSRVLVNTENIFFYLSRKAYSEALSLIIYILEIYKLTLVLDNIITNIIVNTAESVISEKEKLSEIDPLTNIMNRRKFEELLESLLIRSHRTSMPVALTIIDIDDFKQINDTFGHQTGDEVLVEIAGLIRKYIRKNDHLIRYGGEEFVVISNESDLPGTNIMAEKIRAGIAGHDFARVGQVTISLGIATLLPDDTPKTLFERADEKLYMAKSAGKNQVCS